MMQKTTFGAALAFLAAAAGALTAAALYLYRREKELDEYEELLFGEDAYELEDEDETVYEELDPEEAPEEPAGEEEADQ